MPNSLVQALQHSPVPVAAVAQSLWLIIALPILGAFFCGVFGRAMGRSNTHLVALSAVGGSFLVSVLAFWATVEDASRDLIPQALNAFPPPTRYALSHDFGRWFGAGDFVVNFGLRVDHLSGSMLLVITGVGFLIHLYSTRYMEHDEGYWRYFAYLNLFVAMMLTLVLADNLVLLFVGWEGVGLCSYLLIGFWYTDSAKAFAGRKAFVTNRIGDFGFVVGMMLLVLVVGAFQVQNSVGPPRAAMQAFQNGVRDVGPLQFRVLERMAESFKPGSRGLFLPPAAQPGGEQLKPLDTRIDNGPLAGITYGTALTAVLLLFLLGAAGKSAQIPLYVWLPDAMAGPTPVSALIHAATMVTAGVYLFSRLGFLLVLSPVAMVTVSMIGAATALLAALIAFAQDDIKKVLAYSTVSQLGMMFMAVGMGVFWAAVAHLVTHAFFKACLFLGAGSVMHGNGDETDIKKLGGLRKEMPWTWATFLIATLAITGIVPLSGFFSKDAILHGIHSTELEAFPWTPHFIYWVGLLVALCTAFYMMRLYWLTFEGKRSAEAKVAHAHESPWEMTLPLVVLSALSVIGAYLAMPMLQVPFGSKLILQAPVENYLQDVFRSSAALAAALETAKREAEEHLPWAAYGIAWAVALTGGGLAVFLYSSFFPGRAGKPAPAWALGLRRLAQNKFYVDELYDALVIRPIKATSVYLYKVVDGFLIDGVVVHGSARFTAWIGAMIRYLQTGDVQSYAAVMALALFFGVGYALLTVGGVIK